MNVNRNHARVLGAGASMTCALALKSTIYCRAGSIWITQDGDPKDVVLGPGDQFIPDRDTPLVMSALEPSAFSIESWPPRDTAGVKVSREGRDCLHAADWIGV